ncbi:MAG: tyrosine-protein phosphatase [Actinomycetia bacterium]|nr:tyrosine-protein phosphatase [Actinomycetes bacterium]MCH9801998.1 tyrosine-protein phosphatase [Actinomycetes bacterium]
MDVLTLQQLPNARDLGGHRGASGQQVKSSWVLRSAAPTTAEHSAAISQLAIGTVVDFRTNAERTGQPLTVPANVKTVHLDILADEPDDAPASLGRLAAGSPPADPDSITPDLTRGIMLDAYRTFALRPGARQRYSQLLASLVTPSTGPMLLHCTAGKDRTGWATALILLSLGVDRDDVMADYLASAHEVAVLLEPIRRKVAEQGGNVDAVDMVLSVREEYLDTALTAMTEEYGSLSQYLTAGLGLPADFTERLQTHALVADPDADRSDRRTLEP